MATVVVVFCGRPARSSTWVPAEVITASVVSAAISATERNSRHMEKICRRSGLARNSSCSPAGVVVMSASIGRSYRGRVRPPVMAYGRTNGPGSLPKLDIPPPVTASPWQSRLQLGAERWRQHLAHPRDQEGHLVAHQAHVAVLRGE